MYETRKQSHGGDRNSSANFLHLKTADVIGKEYGVTGTTVRNDAEFSKSIDKIANEIGENAKEAILSGRANDRKSKEQNVLLINTAAELQADERT